MEIQKKNSGLMTIATSLRYAAKQAASAGGSGVVQLILPAVCRLCDEPVAEGDDFCRGCLAALTLSEPSMRSACPRCGVPRPATAFRSGRSVVAEPTVEQFDEKAAALSATSDTSLDTSRSVESVEPCHHCRDLDLAFARVVTRWAYHGAVCDAIVAAKYVHQLPLGDALGRQLGDTVAEHLVDDPPDVVTFVPSHISRQFSRGGNGVQAIAEAVARRVSLFSTPVRCRQLLKTTRRIEKQAWLDDQQRQENVRGAFALKRGYAFAGLPIFASRHVLLVDDVLTTGATASEVSRVLCGAGASRVTLAVVARAIRAN